MCRMRMGLIVAVGMILGMGSGAYGQVIRLKSLATADLRQDVRVGDVATVSGVTGKKAEELANTVVVAGIEKPLQLKAETVLMAIITQRGAGAMGSNLQVSGAAVCTIEIAGMSGKTVAMGTAETGVKLGTMAPNLGSNTLNSGSNGDHLASVGAQSGVAGGQTEVKEVKGGAAVTEEGNLRNVIVNKVMKDLGVGEEDVRVEFNTTSPLVEMPVGGGQRWLVRPLTRTMLGTVQFEAQLAGGTKVVQRLNVMTEVKRRQRVLVAAGQIKRGEVVTGEMVRFEDVWMDRNVPTLLAAEKDVIGLEAQRDVDVGAQMDQRDFKPLLMAHKGDAVTVMYVAGPLEVQIRARAMGDGKFHDAIEVRNETTGEKYTAVMVKKGVGVVGTITAELERRIRETQ
jgi:flagella basal body P-ring formation protein FlgA